MNKEQIAKKICEGIAKELDPRGLKNSGDILDLVTRQGRFQTNFAGGANDKARTKHEAIFNLLYPRFAEQVSFGSGLGGLKKYGFKKVTVDFFDKESMMAFEIDGASHDGELAKIKDKIKELFLKIEFGIETVRFTNEEVEKLLYERIIAKLYSCDFDELEELLNGIE